MFLRGEVGQTNDLRRDEEQGQRATRVLDSLSEAEMYIERNKLGSEYFVEERPGGFARCEGYCAVSHICPQLKRENGEEEE